MGSRSSLEELLLHDLQDVGVFDLAASVGMVQPNGRLHSGGRPEDAWPPGSSGCALAPPPRLSNIRSPPLQHLPQLQFHMGPAELHAANQAVMGCLQATEAAAVALRLAELQLEQWGSGEASAGAALSSPTEATATAAGAAAALEHLHSDGPASETPTAAAPTAAAAVPKRKRGGNVVAPPPPPPAASDAAAAAAAAASGRLQGPGKGLRHFSLKVCEKVEEKGDTSYEEVANELIADLAAEVAAGLVEQAHDEKNIRRRVYDALNVLEAIGMITKTKKTIQWKGWPQGLGRSNDERLRAERAKALEGLETKRQALQDAVHKAYCLSNLVLRNREAPEPLLKELANMGLPVQTALKLPFMLVQADGEACMDVDITSDQLTAHIDFQQWPFMLYDDDKIMKLMELHKPNSHLVAELREEIRQQASAAAAAAVGEQQRRAAAAAAAAAATAAAETERLSAQQQQQQQQQQPAARRPLSWQQQAQQQPQELQQQQQLQQPQQQQQRQQQPTNLLQALAAPAATRQHADMLPPQLEHAAGPGHLPAPGLRGLPRLTPSNPPPLTAAAGRLPTPALQLSPALGSPTAAGLGSSVSAMELGSPLGAVARSAAAVGGPAGLFHMQRQQPVLRPAQDPPPAALKAEPAAVSQGIGAAAAPGYEPTWRQWDEATAAYMAGLEQQQQQALPPPQQQQLPQLRPALASTMQLEQLQLRMRQQQPALLHPAGTPPPTAQPPMLQPVRPPPH